MNFKVTIGAAVFVVIGLMSMLVVQAQNGLQERHDLTSRQSRINSSLALLMTGLNDLEASANEGTTSITAFSDSIDRFGVTAEQAGQMVGDDDLRGRLKEMSTPLVAQLDNIRDASLPQKSGVAQIRSARAEFGLFFNETFLRLAGETEKQARKSQVIAMALVIVPVISMLVLMGLLQILVTRRIENLSKFASAVVSGDLDARIVDHGTDELGRLGEGFNEVAQAIQQMLASERRLRDRLLKAERFAMLGEVSAGIVHSFSNPLASIRALAELGTQEAKDPAPFQEILDLSERLERYIADVLRVASPGELAFEMTDFNIVVGEALGILESLASQYSVHLATEFDDDLPKIKSDPAALQRSILAVLENAIEASPPEGTVRLGTSIAGDCMVLEIEDSGPGVSEADHDLVFDQFFTTKKKGTGLGLSTAKRLVSSLGGTITLTPSVDGGTVATLCLPLLAA